MYYRILLTILVILFLQKKNKKIKTKIDKISFKNDYVMRRLSKVLVYQLKSRCWQRPNIKT